MNESAVRPPARARGGIGLAAGAAPDGLLHRHHGVHRLPGLRGRLQGVERLPEDGLNLLGSSDHNTGALGATPGGTSPSSSSHAGSGQQQPGFEAAADRHLGHRRAEPASPARRWPAGDRSKLGTAPQARPR